MDHRAQQLRARLDGLLHRARRRLLGHGAAAAAVTAGAACLAAAWTAGGEAHPPAWAVWGLALSLAALVAAVVVRHLVDPLRRLRRPRQLVARVDRDGSHANLLVAAEESLRRPDRWEGRGAVADVLLGRLRERAAADLARLRPADVAPLPDRRPLAAAGALVLVLAVVLAATAGGDLRRGAARLGVPWRGAAPPPTGGIYGLPAGPFAVAGDTVTLAALDLAAGDDAAVCEIRRGTGHWQEVPARLARTAAGSVGRRWTAAVPDVREDLAWRFRRGTIVSPARQLTVRQRPLLSALAVRVEPPAYTRMPAQDLPVMPGWLEVPAGSRVLLRGRASHAVAAAWLADDAGDSLALDLEGDRFAGALEVRRDRAFRVHLRDGWGLGNAAPLRYEIGAAADEAPDALLERPDDDGLLPLAGVLELAATAADDYGVQALELRLRVRPDAAPEDDASWRALDVLGAPEGAWSAGGPGRGALRWRRFAAADDAPPLQRRQRVELQLDDLDLVAGDVLELQLVARDNRRPGPAGEGRSRVLRLFVPAATDILTEHEERGEARRGELAEMRRRSRELGEDLDRLGRELLKNPVPDWGRRQEMEDALRRRARLQDELSRVADEVRRELEALARGRLTSEQQLRRADEVAGLLESGRSDRLADLMRRLDQGEERPDTGEVTRALREVAREQQDLARRLDAALAMLDRMAEEQEFAGMTALLEQLIQKQQELADLNRERARRQAAADSTAAGDDPGRDGGDEPEGARDPAADPQDGARQAASERTEPAPGEPSPEELARRQEALDDEIARLGEQLEDALERMRERQEDESAPDDAAADERREALEEALARLDRQLAEARRRDQAGEQGEQGERHDGERREGESGEGPPPVPMDPEQAARMQQQMVRDLGSLYHVMIQSQQAMQMAMQMNQAMSLRGLAATLLAVSARQEAIVDQVPPSLREVRTLGLTRDQHRLQKATVRVRDDLAELLTESPMRIMQLLEKLDGLIEEMGHAVRAFEDNRAPAARSHTVRSLATVNRTVISLLTEAQMASGQSGQGQSQGQSAAEQLQEMVRRQAELNGVTDELRRMLADRGISQEARARMQRLGEEQARLAQEARDVAEQERGRPEGERLLGDLGALADDMESVAGDLGGGLADDEVLARQDRILGRMLDARNSVRQRDYSSRRESRTADETYADLPGPAGPRAGTGAEPGPLRYQPLERAPLAYRDLVRRYYAALDSLRRAGVAPPAEGELP